MTSTWNEVRDSLGPAKVLLIHDPLVGLEAIAVVDNVACGPAIGGVRMAPDIGFEEVFRLARAMTLKNAAAGLPHGGCKSGIIARPDLKPLEKERLMRAFARAIAGIQELIPGPDMGTDEACMGFVKDEIGRAVGLPAALGGIPLDEIGATGFGLAVCAEIAQEFCEVRLEGARIVVQGFGAVGQHAARFLVARGARVVAVSDSRGATQAPGGLDVEALIAHKKAGRAVAEFEGGAAASGDELIAMDCEIWIPAARPDVLTAKNADQLQAKLVVPGANIAVTEEAERLLASRDVLVLPDYIANAGGVICAAVEYAGGTRTQAFAAIEERIADNTRQILMRAGSGEPPRVAADAIALERVQQAMRYRRRGLAPPATARPELDL